jgi:hypothetical protein
MSGRAGRRGKGGLLWMDDSMDAFMDASIYGTANLNLFFFSLRVCMLLTNASLFPTNTK